MRSRAALVTTGPISLSASRPGPTLTARAFSLTAAMRSSAAPPTATAAEIASSLAVNVSEVDTALLTLESEGVILRGSFEVPGCAEWCDRRLLARIHRYTLNRLRAEIEPDPRSKLYIPPSRIDELSEPFGNSVHQTRSGL